jgi:hypothetical protein
VTAPVRTAGISPAWAEYAWFARGAESLLYPAVHEFLSSIDAGAAGAPPKQQKAYGRQQSRVRLKLLKLRLKELLGAFGIRRAKLAASRIKVDEALRTLRREKMLLGAKQMQKGALSEAMDRFGSDKGSGWHNYTLFYEMLFRDVRQHVMRVFELGIGSTNPDVPFSMGPDGKPGASLRGWREYFTNAAIFGGDIDRRVLFSEDRITTAFVDQAAPESIDRIFEQFGGDFDLIVDDGFHAPHTNRTFFECAFERLRNRGLFVIEDVAVAALDSYKAFLHGRDAVILEIPNPRNNIDNCLAVVIKT